MGEGENAGSEAVPQSISDGMDVVQSTLETLDVGVFVVGPDRSVEWVNERSLAYFGLAREEVLDRDFDQSVGADIAPALARPERFADTVVGSYEADTYLDEFECHVLPAEDREERWLRYSSNPIEDGALAGGRIEQYVDITDRKRGDGKGERHPQSLQELQTATRELLSAETESEAADCVVTTLEELFESGHAGMMSFEEDEGRLRTIALSSSLTDVSDGPPVVQPGANPVWNVYRDGEARTVTDFRPDGLSVEWAERGSDALVVPIGDHGVAFVGRTESETFDDAAVDAARVLAANASVVLDRLNCRRTFSDISNQVSTHRRRAEELQKVVESIKTIQRRIGSSETRDALETAVCEELATLDRVDFVWIARPKTADTDLSPSAWAGDAYGFLDAVDTDGEDEYLPAQRVANRRETLSISSIAAHAKRDSWAKTALSSDFASVLGVPLVYDDVLYGVLTAYSSDEDAFGDIYTELFSDIASLSVNHIYTLDQRQYESSAEFVDLEVEITDPNCQMHTLAVEAESTIRFDTIAERTERAVRVLVTVVDGDPQQVLDRARELTDVTAAEWFGDPANGQLELTIQTPFLEQAVSKHGGRLVELVADGEATRATIQLPAHVSERPLVDSLTSEYRDIDLVSKGQTTSPGMGTIDDPETVLTDRQFEILKAAYYGGYYDTPRGITGEELAESFDISSPVVYDHLQSSHRSLLDRIFDSGKNQD